MLNPSQTILAAVLMNPTSQKELPPTETRSMLHPPARSNHLTSVDVLVQCRRKEPKGHNAPEVKDLRAIGISFGTRKQQVGNPDGVPQNIPASVGKAHFLSRQEPRVVPAHSLAHRRGKVLIAYRPTAFERIGRLAPLTSAPRTIPRVATHRIRSGETGTLNVCRLVSVGNRLRSLAKRPAQITSYCRTSSALWGRSSHKRQGRRSCKHTVCVTSAAHKTMAGATKRIGQTDTAHRRPTAQGRR